MQEMSFCKKGVTSRILKISEYGGRAMSGVPDRHKMLGTGIGLGLGCNSMEV